MSAVDFRNSNRQAKENDPLLPRRESNCSCCCFNPIQRLVRLVLFVYAARTNCFLRFCQDRYENQVLERGLCGNREVFDSRRLRNGIERLENLGAELTQISTSDNLHLEAIFLSPKTLREKIFENEGKWEKLTLDDGSEVLAILPPDHPREEWNSLHQALSKMRWGKGTFQGKEVIITAHNAEAMQLFDKDICALLVSMNHPFTFDLHTTSFFLGHGITLVSYNGRGICNSEGSPSELGAYIDADAAYQFALKKGFDAKNIWVRGDCMNSWPVTHLMRRYGSIGLNFLYETPPLGLEDLVSQQDCVTKFFARRNLDAALNDPSQDDDLHIKADKFNSLSKAQQMAAGTLRGRIVCVGVIGDQTTPVAKIQSLVDAFKAASFNNENVFFLQIDPSKESVSHPKGLTNNHMLSLHHDPDLSRHFIEILRSNEIS